PSLGRLIERGRRWSGEQRRGDGHGEAGEQVPHLRMLSHFILAGVSHIEHRTQSPTSIRCAVLTVSDTRTDATDTGGRAIATLLTEAGHQVVAKTILRDEPLQVQRVILAQIADEQ